MKGQYLRFSHVSNLIGVKRHTLTARANKLFKNELTKTPTNQVILYPEQVMEIISENITIPKGKILFVGNLKGGVGKTTLTYLSVISLASLGFKVLAIDLDIQANLTKLFYTNSSPEDLVFYDIIARKCKATDAIKTIDKNLHLLPSSLKNGLIEKEFSMQSPKHYLSWFNKIALNTLRSNYDVIVVDTPPQLSNINSVFCLCLTDNDHIVIPAIADNFSIMGIDMFLKDVIEIRNDYNIKKDVNISIILNRFFQAQKNNLEMLMKFGQKYEGMVSEVVIRDNVKIKETINNKSYIPGIKNNKEVLNTMSNLLTEFNILNKRETVCH